MSNFVINGGLGNVVAASANRGIYDGAFHIGDFISCGNKNNIITFPERDIDVGKLLEDFEALKTQHEGLHQDHEDLKTRFEDIEQKCLVLYDFHEAKMRWDTEQEKQKKELEEKKKVCHEGNTVSMVAYKDHKPRMVCKWCHSDFIPYELKFCANRFEFVVKRLPEHNN